MKAGLIKEVFVN